MIKKGNDIFANNIKHLREYYGITQQELATAIGVTYQAIQKYEYGDNIPSKKILRNIFKYFNISLFEITEEELLYTDLRFLGQNTVENTFTYLFPTICNRKLLNNNSFSKAYAIQQYIYKSNSIEDIKLYEDVQKYYTKCINENVFNRKSLFTASYTNLLSFFICYEISYKLGLQRNSKFSEDEVKKYVAEGKTRELFLLNTVNCEDNDEDFTLEEQGEGIEYLTKLHEYNLSLLNKVKSFVNSDLAYYYIAILYYYNCIPNRKERKVNKNIAIEMLKEFAEIGNEYAKNFLNHVEE